MEWSMDTTAPDEKTFIGSVAWVFQKLRHFSEGWLMIILRNYHWKVLSAIRPADEENMADHHKSLVQWMRARNIQIPVKLIRL